MKAPLCEVCLKSNFLCSYCQEKFDKKEISQTDIEISRYLYELSEKAKSLKDAKIKKIIDAGVLLIITERGDAAKLVGKDGYVVKALAKKFRKSIRVLEEAPDMKKFVQDLISPTIVNGINTLYTPLGTIYRVRVPSTQKNKMLIAPENFSSIIENVYNCKAELIFD